MVPRLFTEAGPVWSRKPVREQYRDVIRNDQVFRQLIGDLPPFLLREDTAMYMVDKPWIEIARRSLAITAAEKVNLVHLLTRSKLTSPDHLNSSPFPLPFFSNTILSAY